MQSHSRAEGCMFFLHGVFGCVPYPPVRPAKLPALVLLRAQLAPSSLRATHPIPKAGDEEAEA